MSFKEAAHDLSCETSDHAQERSDVLTQCNTDLSNLKTELVSDTALPPNVMQAIRTAVPAELQEYALNAAIQMQRDNPVIFAVPDDVLPLILRPVIDQAEIAARTDRIQDKQAENTDMDQKIAEGRTTVDVLSDDTVEAESELNDKAGLEQLMETGRNPETGEPADPPLDGLAGRLLLNTLLRQAYVRERPNLITYLETVKGQLEAIGRLAATPEEAVALDNILDNTPLYLGADTIGGVFSDVLVAADNNPDLSETTKANIHKLFNIPTVQTAGDLQMVLNNGYGVDAHGNKIPISTDQKLRVMPNTYLYEMPSGDRIFEIAVPGVRKYQVRFDEGTPDQVLYHSAFTIQTMGLMAQMNLASAIWPRGFTLQEGGVIDLHYDDIITAQRVAILSKGGTIGHDSRLLSESDYRDMQHLWQGFPKKGQASEGDNDPDRALAEYKELTIVGEDSSINWTQFERAALYLQDVSRRGAEPNFEDLKQYLQGTDEVSS